MDANGNGAECLEDQPADPEGCRVVGNGASPPRDEEESEIAYYEYEGVADVSDQDDVYPGPSALCI